MKVVIGLACREGPRVVGSRATYQPCNQFKIFDVLTCPKLLTGALGFGASFSLGWVISLGEEMNINANLVIRFPTLNREPEGGALGDVNLPGCLGSAFGGGFAFGGLGGRVVTKSACSAGCNGTVVLLGDSKSKPWNPGKLPCC